MERPAVRDAALFVFRACIGLVFVIHGMDVFVRTGITSTATKLGSSHIPQPRLSAILIGGVETLTGAMLVVGFLTAVAATILILLMCAAAYLVHWPHGFFVTSGGMEYVLVLALALGMLIVFGPGRASVDNYLTR